MSDYLSHRDRSPRGRRGGLRPTWTSPGRVDGPAWPCTGRGLPGRRVTATPVRSYRTISPLPVRDSRVVAPSAVYFCGTVPRVSPGGRYPPPCPLVSGLSSRGFLSPRSHSARSAMVARRGGLETNASITWHVTDIDPEAAARTAEESAPARALRRSTSATKRLPRARRRSPNARWPARPLGQQRRRTRPLASPGSRTRGPGGRQRTGNDERYRRGSGADDRRRPRSRNQRRLAGGNRCRPGEVSYSAGNHAAMAFTLVSPCACCPGMRDAQRKQRRYKRLIQSGKWPR